MRRRTVTALLTTARTRYGVALGYIILLTLSELVYALLPGDDRRALLRWASTNVHNLPHNPVGTMVVSAFFPAETRSVWPLLAALGLLGANRALGNWRTAVVCVCGHVIGTLVSEGIVDYRVAHGTLPDSAKYIIDVGPSYVVVAAIAVAILYGSWLARGAAVLDLCLLTFVGGIFWGLGGLQVSAVGHLTSITTGVLVGSLAYWQRRRSGQAAVAPEDAAPEDAAPEATAEPGDRRDPDQKAQPRPRA